MEEKLTRKVTDTIKQILEEDINGNNIDPLYKLVKIKHIMKEDDKMNYGNYYGDRYSNYGRDMYGREEYGRRGRDSRGRYRGHDMLDRVYEDYGRYEESRNRYGAGEESDKSHHYMVKSLEDFVRYLYEDSDTPQQKQMITEALQRSMR